jgi:hypothetical protein
MNRHPSTNAKPVVRRPIAGSLRVVTLAIALGLLFAPGLALAQTSRGVRAGGARASAKIAVAARRSHQPPRLLMGDFTSRFAVRPATISFGVSANEIIGGTGISLSQFEAGKLGHIRWSHWTSASAVGHGLMWSNDCSPNCPEGTYHAGTVAITAHDGFSGRYRRLSYVYRADGRRVHIHARLRRMPGTPDAWSWW